MAENAFNAGFGLPLEYQSEVDALARRRAIAQALQMQTMQPIQVQQLGPMASKLPMGAVLGQALAGFLSGRNVAGYEKESSALATKAQNEGLAEMGSLSGMGDKRAQIAAASVSRFPGIRQQGQLWQKDLSENVRAGAGIVGPEDPAAAMRMLSSGQLDTGYARPPVPGVQFGAHPDDPKALYGLTTNRKGEQGVVFNRQPDQTRIENKMSNVIPTKEAETSLSILEDSRKERVKLAQPAKANLDGLQSAFDALQRGAAAGGGEGIIQGVRKAAQFLNIDLPKTDSVDELQAALGNGLIANARALAPVTEQDVKFLQQTSGSINTDPSALTRMLGRMYAGNLRTLQEYQQWLEAKGGALDSPYAKAHLAGEGVGLEPPKSITLPEPLMVYVMNELKRRGGDPKQWGVDTQFSGQEAPLSNKVWSPPAAALSPAEQKELERLRKRRQ